MAVLLVLLIAASFWSHRVAPSDAASVDGQRVRVVRVIDGDTLDMEADGTTQRVRLRGIDAPETNPPAYWGENAKRYLEARIARQGEVVLKFDPPQTHDRFGRLLAFVYVSEGECLNLSLVRDGQAFADRRFDSFMRSQLAQAETLARKKKTGLWREITDDQQPVWRQEWLARNRASK